VKFCKEKTTISNNHCHNYHQYSYFYHYCLLLGHTACTQCVRCGDVARSMVCMFVCLYVGGGHMSELAKLAELIEMLFEGLTDASPKKHVLNGFQIPPPQWEGALLKVNISRPILMNLCMNTLHVVHLLLHAVDVCICSLWNDKMTTAMQPLTKLLWTLVITVAAVKTLWERHRPWQWQCLDAALWAACWFHAVMWSEILLSPSPSWAASVPRSPLHTYTKQ